jgi:membrane protein YqaA with SNARE-associated domain
MHLLALLVLKKTFWNWLRALGGPGLILLALVDNSAIPLPGSMDALTIVLAASHKQFWWYYALMATVGSLIGGYLTYRLGVKGGKETLEKKISKRRAEKVYRIFDRFGFWSIVIGAVSPPPTPIVPFLLAPGTLHYPVRKFLTALALGRGVRYTLLAYFASNYGHQILHWFGRYYRPLLYILIAGAIVGGLVGLFYWMRYKRQHPGRTRGRQAKRAA